MKTTIQLFLLGIALNLINSSFAQQTFQVFLNSGTENLELNASSFAFSETDLKDPIVYKIIHFNDLIHVDKERLKASGIELLNYLPKNAFYAKLNPKFSYDFKLLGIDAIHDVSFKHRLSHEIYYGLYPEHALNGNKLSLNIICFEGEQENTYQKLISNNLEPLIKEDVINVQLPIDLIQTVGNWKGICYIESIEQSPQPLNLPGKTSHGSSYLNGSNDIGLNYDGYGITVMMTDDGYIGPHIDFKNRVDQSSCPTCSDSPSATHGDHVAGTIMGSGNLNPDAKGMATGINFIVKNAALNELALTEDAPLLYTSDSLVITSRSYANGCAGNYWSTTVTLDKDSRENRSLLHICAGGNYGEDNCNGIDGWANMSNLEQAMKNGIAVGNLDRNDVINSSSSRGPLPDGRLKPDICGVGTAVSSTQPDNTYANFNGTSMACPGVAGTMAQLYQAYKELNSGEYPASGLMKAVVLNSANDLGNPGPDFIYGWGKINGRKAYNTLLNQTYIIDTIATGQTNNISLTIPPGVKEARIMLYWTDFESTQSASLHLVNDLDLNVTDPSSATLLPLILDHTLDVASLSAVAVPGVDTVNNVEQVRLIDPVAGTYSINIEGTAIPEGPQEYFVVYEFITDDIVINYPNGGERMLDGQTEIIRWDTPSNISDFTIELSTDNGVNWSSIGTAPASDRQFSWGIPFGLDTKDARIRVSNGITTDESDDNFSIYERPGGLNVKWACSDSLLLKWNPVNNAFGYEVSMLGNMFMDSIGFTTVDSFVVYAPWTDTLWLSVSSISNTGAQSKRAYAISKEPGQFGCTWEPPVVQFAVDCDTVSTANCQTFTSLSDNTDANSNYSWYFPTGTPSFSTDLTPTVCFADTGYHSAALVAMNSAGTDSLWMDSVFYTISSESLNYLQGFEYSTISDIPNWYVVNDAGFGFERTSNAAHSGQHSMVLRNFGQPAGRIDQVVSGPIDLSGVDTSQNEFITLSFRYAHRKRATADYEILKLKVKGGCQAGWAPRKTLSGPLLSTEVSSTAYTPSPDDWITVHVTNITPQFFVPDFRFMFEFTSDQGNNLYIDDINIYKGAPSDDLIAELIELDHESSVLVYPNPASDELFVNLYSDMNGEGNLVLMDLQGKQIARNPIELLKGENEWAIDVAGLSDGIYIIRLETTIGTVNKRIQVTH